MRYGLSAVLCVLYAAVILYPFRWSAPRRVENGAEPIPRGWRFEAPGIVRGPAPSGDLDLRLRVRPARADQTGPARILTISYDPSLRNLLIGQRSTDLVVRVRSHDSNANGIPEYVIRSALRAGRWADIRLTLAGRELAVSVDGVRRLARTFSAPPQETWDPRYELALGNERGGLRPWLGEIEYAGSVRRPASFWTVAHIPRLIPFRDAELKDMLLNFFGFFPFGIVLVFARWSARASALLAAGCSALIELAQLAMVGRVASTTDLLLNTAGALLGALIALRLAAARATRHPAARG